MTRGPPASTLHRHQPATHEKKLRMTPEQVLEQSRSSTQLRAQPRGRYRVQCRGRITAATRTSQRVVEAAIEGATTINTLTLHTPYPSCTVVSSRTQRARAQQRQGGLSVHCHNDWVRLRQFAGGREDSAARARWNAPSTPGRARGQTVRSKRW